jgi:hypothetical protein
MKEGEKNCTFPDFFYLALSVAWCRLCSFGLAALFALFAAATAERTKSTSSLPASTKNVVDLVPCDQVSIKIKNVKQKKRKK